MTTMLIETRWIGEPLACRREVEELLESLTALSAVAMLMSTDAITGEYRIVTSCQTTTQRTESVAPIPETRTAQIGAWSLSASVCDDVSPSIFDERFELVRAALEKVLAREARFFSTGLGSAGGSSGAPAQVFAGIARTRLN